MDRNLKDIKDRLIAFKEDGASEKELHRYIDVGEIEKFVELFESYRDTLIFYGNEDTYHFDKWGSPIERDYGNMARKVLEEEEHGDPYEPTPASEEELRNGGYRGKS